MLAVVRSLPGPVFFPLRLMVIVYTDFFRGVPTILVVYVLGFGMPGLQLTGIPTEPGVLGRRRRSCSSTAPTSPRCTGPGSSRSIPSQEAAARSLGLSRGQTLRYVIVPQAVRRVIPPLLNDFIGLQKDTALVSVLGSVDALQQANINSAADFNYTPYLVAAFFFVLHHDPARALHRLADRARAAPAAGGRARMSAQPQLVVEGVHKSFGKNEVLRGIDLRGGRARGGVPDRRVRLGQVDAASLHQPARADRRGPDRRRAATTSPPAASTRTSVRRGIGIVFQAFNLFPHMTRACAT